MIYVWHGFHLTDLWLYIQYMQGSRLLRPPDEAQWDPLELAGRLLSWRHMAAHISRTYIKRGSQGPRHSLPRSSEDLKSLVVLYLHLTSDEVSDSAILLVGENPKRILLTTSYSVSLVIYGGALLCLMHESCGYDCSTNCTVKGSRNVALPSTLSFHPPRLPLRQQREDVGRHAAATLPGRRRESRHKRQLPMHQPPSCTCGPSYTPPLWC